MVKMGDVWDRTVEFLGDNLGAITPVALLAFFLPFSIQSNFAALGDEGQLPQMTQVALGVAQLAFAVVMLWGQLVITVMALDIAGGAGPARIASARLLPVLGASLILFAALLVLFLPVPVLAYLGGVDVAALQQGRIEAANPSILTAIALYMLVLTPVLLWLGARFALVQPAVAREGRPLGAIARSWQLTRGYALRIVGVLILYYLVSSVAYGAARLVFGSIFALVAGAGDGGLSVAGVLTSIACGAVQTASAVVLPAFAGKLYLAINGQAGLTRAMEDL